MNIKFISSQLIISTIHSHSNQYSNTLNDNETHLTTCNYLPDKHDLHETSIDLSEAVESTNKASDLTTSFSTLRSNLMNDQTPQP